MNRLNYQGEPVEGVHTALLTIDEASEIKSGDIVQIAHVPAGFEMTLLGFEPVGLSGIRVRYRITRNPPPPTISLEVGEPPET